MIMANGSVHSRACRKEHPRTRMRLLRCRLYRHADCAACRSTWPSAHTRRSQVGYRRVGRGTWSAIQDLWLGRSAPASADFAGVDVVLNAAGPFLQTAEPLAQPASRRAHYLDIGNELQVFISLYNLHRRAERAGVTIIPGVGFGTVATNCLARSLSESVGGAQWLEVATRSNSQPGTRCRRVEARQPPLWRLDSSGGTIAGKPARFGSHDDDPG